MRLPSRRIGGGLTVGAAAAIGSPSEHDGGRTGDGTTLAIEN